jgi:hypothetical protein
VGRIAQRIRTLVSASAPHGFATDWIDFAPGRGFSASDAGSLRCHSRAICGPACSTPPHPDEMRYCASLSGMADWLRKNAAPPEESAARWQRRRAERARRFLRRAASRIFLAIGEKTLADSQFRSTALGVSIPGPASMAGRPGTTTQNLALFALGWTERRFWFDSSGTLKTWWKN